MQESVLRLFRCCTKRDIENNYTLKSSVIWKLSNKEQLEELISHELRVTSRNVFYSFSSDIQKVRNYKKKYQPDEESDLCYVDVKLEHIPDSIVTLIPVCSRDYMMNAFCSSDEILKSGSIVNPSDDSEHSLLGIINVSQRTVCSWAYSMREFCLQANGLKLNLLKEGDDIIQSDEQVEALIRKYLLKSLPENNIMRFREIIQNDFKKYKLKKTYILDRVMTDLWYKP